MGNKSIDEVFLSRIYTALEGARANAGDAYSSKDLTSLKGEIKEAETYFTTAVESMNKNDCAAAYQHSEKGLAECRNAFESDNMSDAKEASNNAMEHAIQAIEAANKCYADNDEE